MTSTNSAGASDKTALRAHAEWIGLCQPVGLVVSPTALVQAQAFVDRNVKGEQDALKRLIEASVIVDERAKREPVPRVESIEEFVVQVLGWEPSDLDKNVDAFNVVLEDYGETLRATYVVNAKDKSPILLIKVLPTGTDLDDAKNYKERMWQASAQARFERILWESSSSAETAPTKGTPIGLLWNGVEARLVYVPRGETSGHITFPLAALCDVANRPMLSALKMLLSPERLWTLPTKQRLPALLAESRKYQNTVSTELAEQVLAALAELLSGFQAADEHAQGGILGDLLATEDGGEHVYGGLLSVLLRLVFVLYAEDRGLLPDDDTWREGYSVTRLFAKLRDDVDQNPDTMEDRRGAWAQLVSLFRLIHDGGAYRTVQDVVVNVPKREGQLFNPATYPFLEGRSGARQTATAEREGGPLNIPHVSDGVVYRVLSKLLILHGQRLSYRTLDVEQIGSVYEGLMGFKLERATGPTIAVRPQHVYVDLGALLEEKPADRAKVLKEQSACDLAAKAATALKEAKSVDDVVAAIGAKVSPRTQAVMPLGSLYLQPTDERRRSGSHYTPRALTKPIVETALRPIFERLVEEAKDKKKGPSPDQILDLKVCDPAMGSGAFLVEACRHGEYPLIPPDEAPLLHAMRKVATRCLYGVDKNRFAVELAKLSLWLATLAKDHPFTFVDHTLRSGDSLVGLTKSQVSDFTWEERGQRNIASQWIDDALKIAEISRRTIAGLGDTSSNDEKKRLLKEAEDEIGEVRMIGDACVSAFFWSLKPAEQKRERERLLDVVFAWQTKDKTFEPLLAAQARLGAGDKGVKPFHWQVEFPEVFTRTNSGFDIIIGNPPFMGGHLISGDIGKSYLKYLTTLWDAAGDRTDLVAYFFRRSFDLLRVEGTLGLIATNTAIQGDTRRGGLGALVRGGGLIFAADRRLRWPGRAAVVVVRVWVAKTQRALSRILNGTRVDAISSYLLRSTVNDAPVSLLASRSLAFRGVEIGSQGFVINDDDGCIPVSVADAALRTNPRCHSIIKPYMGGEELNDDLPAVYRRRVVDLVGLDEATVLANYSPLAEVVRDLVIRDRGARKSDIADAPWWEHWRSRPELRAASAHLKLRIAGSQTSKYLMFTFVDAAVVPSHKAVVVASDSFSMLALISARPHELWATALGSSMKDDPVYTPSDCFETFPFPLGWKVNSTLEGIGKRYHDFRAALMVTNNEGLTKTYNRFHEPSHDGSGVEGRAPAAVVKDIEQLRALHADMDRAVLDAYGWTDIKPTCEFLLDYEEDDDEDEDAGKKRKKKPWRYRWPDDVRDEVLARLLELNRKRAEEERLLGAEASTRSSSGFALEAQSPTPKKKTARKPK